MDLRCSLLLLALCASTISAKNFTKDELLSIINEYVTFTTSYKLPTDNSAHINTTSNTIRSYGSFDFVIVGGGAAGTLLANRLSQISNWTILLLEAGEAENDFSHIPAMNYYLRSSPFNWGYYTKPQNNSCQGMANKTCVYPAGKGLGGSCILGDMVYLRGNRANFDLWGREGNSGWSYEEVLPYFKKTEQIETSKYDQDYHGLTGELKVANSFPDPMNHESWINANIQLGLNESDPNGIRQTGISKMPWTLDFNQKLTGGNTFIAPIVNTTANLNVSLYSFVTKVLFNGRRAQGIEFVRNSIKYTVEATKEVILSAGAINTPQLLMLSGVGPKEELDKHGITVVEDLPVGKYLKDQPVYLPLYIRTNTTAPAQTLEQQAEAYLRGESPLTTVFSAGPVGFINTRNRTSSVPNVEIIFVNPPQSVPGDTSMFYNLDEKHQQLFSGFNTMTDHLVYVINVVPKSVGTVTLKSNNIKDFPIVDPAFYTDAENDDIEVVYEGIQYILDLLDTPAAKALNATVVGVAPECEQYWQTNDREYWMCAIKYLTSTIYRPSSTTRMGKSPKNSVVDDTLKVHNLRGLRVVDGGSMPETVAGHFFAAVYMMAEKAADMIKAEYKQVFSF